MLTRVEIVAESFCDHIFVERNRDPDRQAQFDRSEKCMNAMSMAAVLGSSAFMVILGMPPVTKRLLAFALGDGEILEFSAFTLENLKGSLISLGIGAAVYLTRERGAISMTWRDGAWRIETYLEEPHELE